MVVKVKHTKGKHYASLLSLLKIYFASLFLKDREVYISFTEDSKYNLNNRNKMDWSKAIGRGGLSYGKDGGQGYPTRKNEEFIVWRYDIENDEFHVANTYARKNHRMQLPDYWLKCKVGDRVKTNMRLFKGVVPIGGYFGGNDPAPNDLTYTIHLK